MDFIRAGRSFEVHETRKFNIVFKAKQTIEKLNKQLRYDWEIFGSETKNLMYEKTMKRRKLKNSQKLNYVTI